MFWRRTPRETLLHFDAHARRHKREQERRRQEVYTLAALIAIGFNNPKKFPDAESFLHPPMPKTASEKIDDLRLWVSSDID